MSVRGTYQLTSKSFEEAMADLELRKSKNIENSEIITEYSPFSIGGKTMCYVKYDEVGEIKSCLCGKCLNQIPRSPVYNSKFVYPVCRECLSDIEHIENTERKNAKMKTNSKKNDVSQVNFDWKAFEQAMADGSAKLVKMADSYNVYPTQLKAAIISKYGNQIAFKKGRNGGIIWATKTIGQ